MIVSTRSRPRSRIWRDLRCIAADHVTHLRLQDVEGDRPVQRKFETFPIGYLHIDIAEVQTVEGRLYFYMALDRTSRVAFVQIVMKTGRTSASAFLTALIEAVPYKTHTVLNFRAAEAPSV